MLMSPMREQAELIAAAYGFENIENESDNNSLYHAVFSCLKAKYKGDEEKLSEDLLKKRTLDYIKAHQLDYEPFFTGTEGWSTYVGRLEKAEHRGDDTCVSALSAAFGVTIVVLNIGCAPSIYRPATPAPNKAQEKIIYLSHHQDTNTFLALIKEDENENAAFQKLKATIKNTSASSLASLPVSQNVSLLASSLGKEESSSSSAGGKRLWPTSSSSIFKKSKETEKKEKAVSSNFKASSSSSTPKSSQP